jgi:hypothetical protein
MSCFVVLCFAALRSLGCGELMPEVNNSLMDSPGLVLTSNSKTALH